MIGNGKKTIFSSPEGGTGYWVVNRTGADSVKGMVVEPSDLFDNAVQLIGIDDADPIGVIYDEGVPDGEKMRIIFSGKAKVMFSTSTTRNYFARNAQTADPTATAGMAIAEPLPTPPFATDKHFLEIGHILETIASAGLALTNLHFN